MITETKTTNSFFWLAAIQITERKQDSTSLAPKRGFVPAESIEREIGLISQAQKTLRERESGTISLHAKAEFGSSEQRLNNVLRMRVGLAVSLERLLGAKSRWQGSGA